MNYNVTSDKCQMTRRERRKLQHSSRVCRRSLAFTLIEVMIALGIFFMAMFAILGVVCNALRNARALQRKTVDCGPLASLVVTMTNRFDEGPLPPQVVSAFEDAYPDFTADGEVREVSTNHLYQVDMIVQRRSGGPVESVMSILIFSPDSPPGPMDRGVGAVRPGGVRPGGVRPGGRLR